MSPDPPPPCRFDGVQVDDRDRVPTLPKIQVWTPLQPNKISSFPKDLILKRKKTLNSTSGSQKNMQNVYTFDIIIIFTQFSFDQEVTKRSSVYPHSHSHWDLDVLPIPNGPRVLLLPVTYPSHTQTYLVIKVYLFRMCFRVLIIFLSPPLNVRFTLKNFKIIPTKNSITVSLKWIPPGTF